MDDDKWTGQYRVNEGRVRSCGHRHSTADLADRCAGQMARKVAKESK